MEEYRLRFVFTAQCKKRVKCLPYAVTFERFTAALSHFCRKPS